MRRPVITIRKTGSARYPWQAHCRVHRGAEETYITKDGVVAFNTRGVGNRTHRLAVLAAEGHLRNRHKEEAS